MRDAYVCGVGVTKFFRRSAKQPAEYPEFASEAGAVLFASNKQSVFIARHALNDAGVDYMRDVKASVVSYCYGEPTSGQRALLH